MAHTKDCDSYIIDTYKVGGTGRFKPAALLFAGRRKMETLQWKEAEFATQAEADAFVRAHCAALDLREAGNEGELRKD